MGNTFSGGTEYNLEEHGQNSRELFDEYINDSTKFQDLSNKVVAITGTSANSIGFHIAEIAVRKNAKILMLCNRDSKSSAKGTEELKTLAKECNSPTQIEIVTCDLQDLSSVKDAATKINEIATKYNGLDILICNAGVMAMKDTRTKDGYDIQMQTNQLSHFVLTQGVWKSIQMAAKNRDNARIVTHSSSARDGPGGNLQKEYFMKSEPGTLGGESSLLLQMSGIKAGHWTRYHMTKLANANFAMALHDKIAASDEWKDKIQANSADPGLATSNLQVTTVNDGGMPHWLTKIFAKNGQSPADGSLPIGMCAFGIDTKSGSFYIPEHGATGKPIPTIENGIPITKKNEKLVISKENKENVWKWCEEALDMKFDI